jgi:hypothetical protein
MREEAAKMIDRAQDHPLKFLLDSNGKFKSSHGLKHDELINRPDVVEMGHFISKSSGQPERIMLQGAWENQYLRIMIEKPKSGIYAENVAVEIGGIAVDIKTAKFWEDINRIPKGTVDTAARITFYSQ